MDTGTAMTFPRAARRYRLVLCFVAALAAALGAVPRAADFDVDRPRLLLRRLQYCRECGSALVVSRIRPGVLVRCPDCGEEQPRLPDRHLLSQLYQLCKICGFPLDPAGVGPGEAVECGNCRARQVMDAGAFALAGKPNGP